MPVSGKKVGYLTFENPSPVKEIIGFVANMEVVRWGFDSFRKKRKKRKFAGNYSGI